MKPCNHDSHADYEKLVGPLREVANANGYAIGVHGTLIRDIDLIACPWTNEAVSGKELAQLFRRKIEELNGAVFDNPYETKPYEKDGRPGYKAHGRLVWVFHLTEKLSQGPYVDLSVMPRWSEEFGDSLFFRYVKDKSTEVGIVRYAAPSPQGQKNDG